MKLIIIHQNKDSQANNNSCTTTLNQDNASASELLRFAFCSEPFNDIAVSCFNHDASTRGNSDVIAIPQSWAAQAEVTKTTGFWRRAAMNGRPKRVYYNQACLPASLLATKSAKPNSWLIVLNGRFVTRINHQELYKILARLRADIVAVNVLTQLQAASEKAIVTPQRHLVGFRRFYNDLIQPAPLPSDWPHCLFIRTEVLNKLFMSNTLSLNFSEFVDNCFSNSLTLRSFNVGGTILDLGTEEGLLGLLVTNPNIYKSSYSTTNNGFHRQVTGAEGVTVSPDAKLFGKILFGRNVCVERNAIVIGPVIIGNDVKISSGAVVRTSIIDSGVSLSNEQLVQNRVLISQIPKQKKVLRQLAASRTCKKTGQIGMPYSVGPRNHIVTSQSLNVYNFRTWPKCSYVRFLKRIADIVAAIIVLVLFAPIMPFVVLAIKLNSSGPVFFGDERQGLHGKTFKCLKFRTMLPGADKLQDRLRRINQVDGPQFRIENDPRTSAVGRFLRDTHIDEIPQFVNVLLGQMSIVGPRPSPEAENTLCPYWRDARLSVRPGITGLWQICRTRRPTKDFQEWIYYDIEYVRKLSLKLDLWVCWKTAKKLIHNFISQF